jgi:hypothetical protein
VSVESRNPNGLWLNMGSPPDSGGPRMRMLAIADH